jgi:hypothetical protein
MFPARTRTVKEDEITVTKVFIPFPKANSAAAISTAKSWNKGLLGIFCADDTNKQTHLKHLTNANHMLYICGHCDKGSKYLESSDHKKKVSAEDIVTLLIGDLAKEFCGIVKIYGCESARGKKSIWSQNQDAFAQRLANAMYAGYKSCSFYGYQESITMGRTDHKYVVGTNNRASSVRMQIIPNVVT